jgi:hypothetical protein
MGTPIGVLWWGGSEGSAGLAFPFTPHRFPPLMTVSFRIAGGSSGGGEMVELDQTGTG